MTDPRGNEELGRRLTDAWNERDRETVAALYAEEFVEGDQPEGRTSAEQGESEWTCFEAFPDVEPTGAHVEYAIRVFYRVVEGEPATMDVRMDLVGLLSRLGAVDWPPE